MGDRSKCENCRYNIPVLAKKYKVYAIDLLGFGWSEKALVDYEATVWMEQVSDFLREVVKEPAVLVGNRYSYAITVSVSDTRLRTSDEASQFPCVISLGGFTTLFAATEAPELVRGVVLLNSAGQFADPDKPASAAPAEGGEEGNPLSRFIVRPLKEAFQRVVLGFLFWQSKQPARVEKVLKSVTCLEPISPAASVPLRVSILRICIVCFVTCRCTSTPATSTSTSSAPSRRRRPTPTPARSTTGRRSMAAARSLKRV